MVETIIWFSVSVPVLSVLIALVAPSVSTSVRFLTTAFASASCFAPIESRPETNAGMPVGIAEIAIAVPSSSDVAERLAAGDADDDDERRPPPRDDPEHLRQGAELLLQRRPRAGDRGQHRRDLAHLGLHAGRGDDHRRRAAGDGRVLEQHVGAVAERDVRAGEHAGILRDGRALAGEGRLLRLERGRAHDAAVGGDDVARLQLDDVAGHDVGRRDQRHRRRRARPSPAAPAGSRARRCSPAPAAPAASRAPGSAG